MRRFSHRPLLQWAMIVLAFSASLSAIQAQEEAAPVSASIHISKSLPYEKESVILTLTIKTVGVQFRKQIDLVNLPDKKQFDIFSNFETLPTKRVGNGHRITEIHRSFLRYAALSKSFTYASCYGGEQSCRPYACLNASSRPSSACPTGLPDGDHLMYGLHHHRADDQPGS